MTKTMQGYPGCPYYIVKRRETNGAGPEDHRAGDVLAGIDERPAEVACNVGNCALTGSEMMSVMKPDDTTTEDLAVIASNAPLDCKFANDAATTITTRLGFDEMTQRPEA